MITDLPPVLTPKHIMQHTGFSENKVYELLRVSPDHGGIRCARIKTADSERARILIRREWFLEWLDRLAGVQPQASETA